MEQSLASKFNSLNKSTRQLSLSIFIGIVAGLGAIIFYGALKLATNLFLHKIAAFYPPNAAGEGGPVGDATIGHRALFLLSITLGSLIAGVIVFLLAPEAEGHGTDAAISAVHNDPKGVRLRAVAVKIVASALTIGSGGSAGREGPTAQISAGIGSVVARWLNLDEVDAKLVVAVGLGSGIGAIFKAPLGGAILASEILFASDFEISYLVPSMVASGVAYVIFGSAYGFASVFSVPNPHFVVSISSFALIAVLGLAAGLAGVAYSKAFYFTVSLARRLKKFRYFLVVLGGFLVGLIGFIYPQDVGTGYGYLQQMIDGGGALGKAALVILLIGLLRIVATSLSIGLGGSGGVFGPGVVVGGYIGASVWKLAVHIAPSLAHQEAAFIVIGMTACFGAIARAPLAMIALISEMTNTIVYVGPTLIAITVALGVVTLFGSTIYESQLVSKEDPRTLDQARKSKRSKATL
ncbi:MAG: chloride channel protein [Actinomycetota bacterium]|nr:chloride channel protein [Actinomycetota bacterium]